MKTHSAFQETPLDKCNEELIHCSLYGSTWFVSWIFTQFFPRFIPFHNPHLFSSFNYSEHHFASLDSIQLFLFADRRVPQFPVFFILKCFFLALCSSLQSWKAFWWKPSHIDALLTRSRENGWEAIEVSWYFLFVRWDAEICDSLNSWFHIYCWSWWFIRCNHLKSFKRHHMCHESGFCCITKTLFSLELFQFHRSILNFFSSQ